MTGIDTTIGNCLENKPNIMQWSNSVDKEDNSNFSKEQMSVLLSLIWEEKW